MITAIGEVLWDHKMDSRTIGGAPLNVAYHISRYGHEVAIVSAVGDDREGEELLRTVESHRLPIDWITVREGGKTGSARVIGEGAEVEFIIDLESAWANRMWGEELDDLARRSSVVVLGTLGQYPLRCRNTIRDFVGRIPEECTVVVDINLRQELWSQDILEWSLRAGDIVKMNGEELDQCKRLFGDWALGNRFERELCSQFAIEEIVVTRGSDGAEYISESEELAVDACEVEEVDAVGAGDAFLAAYVVRRVMDQKSALESINRATNLAAAVVQRLGAMPKMPARIYGV